MHACMHISISAQAERGNMAWHGHNWFSQLCLVAQVILLCGVCTYFYHVSGLVGTKATQRCVLLDCVKI